VLDRIAGKWTIMAVGALSGGPMRFNAMARLIGGVSQRMLTLTLRNLEKDGLVTRTVCPTIPPRVDYELTALGRTLIEPLGVLSEWAQAHSAEMEAARAAYAQRQEPGSE
jgi:DNA-binding HxlR family transcriptional regulator